MASLPLLREFAVLLHEVVLHCGEIQEKGEGTHPQPLQCRQQHGQACVSIYRLFTELLRHLYASKACNDAQTVPNVYYQTKVICPLGVFSCIRKKVWLRLSGHFARAKKLHILTKGNCSYFSLNLFCFRPFSDFVVFIYYCYSTVGQCVLRVNIYSANAIKTNFCRSIIALVSYAMVLQSKKRRYFKHWHYEQPNMWYRMKVSFCSASWY